MKYADNWQKTKPGNGAFDGEEICLRKNFLEDNLEQGWLQYKLIKKNLLWEQVGEQGDVYTEINSQSKLCGIKQL